MSTSNTGASEAIWPCDPRRGTAMTPAINTIAISNCRMIRADMDEPPADVARNALYLLPIGATSTLGEVSGSCRGRRARRMVTAAKDLRQLGDEGQLEAAQAERAQSLDA